MIADIITAPPGMESAVIFGPMSNNTINLLRKHHEQVYRQNHGILPGYLSESMARLENSVRMEQSFAVRQAIQAVNNDVFMPTIQAVYDLDSMWNANWLMQRYITAAPFVNNKIDFKSY